MDGRRVVSITAFCNLAAAQVGVPYVFGGTHLAGTYDAGLDCSGLPYAVALYFGVTIPRTSEAQFAGLPPVGEADLRRGDLVFYDVPTDNQAQPAHEAIWWDVSQVLQAPRTGEDVMFSSPLPYTIMGYRRLPFPDPVIPVPPPIPQEDILYAFENSKGETVIVGTVNGHTAVVTSGQDASVSNGWSFDDVTDAIEAAYPGTVVVVQ
jgi:hypothetical protein